jgi:hypothetical protein
MLSVTLVIWQQMIWCLWIMNWEACGWKQSWSNLRYYSGIYLERLRKTMETVSQSIQWHGWDSNQAFPKYESQALPLESPCSVHYSFSKELPVKIMLARNALCVYVSCPRGVEYIVIFFYFRWIMACATCMGVFGQAITHAVGTAWADLFTPQSVLEAVDLFMVVQVRKVP